MMVPFCKKRESLLLASPLLPALAASAWVSAPDPVKESPTIIIMSQNLLPEAELAPALLAKTPEKFFMTGQTALRQVAAPNFPERARVLATEIADRQPHLVGLHRAYNFTLEGRNGPPPFGDHLADLLAALADWGAHDYAAAGGTGHESRGPPGGYRGGVQ